MFAVTNAGGSFIATVPDVCKTPTPGGPVPVPYPNIAQGALLSPGTLSSKVSVAGGMAATMKSETTLSNGDEAGVNGGVASNKFIGKAAFIKGSSKVRIEGKAALRMGDPSTHNEKNTMGSVAAPSQSKVMMGG